LVQRLTELACKENEMKLRVIIGVAALCIATAAQSNAQLGEIGFKRPNIANIFHPVVGGGATYEQVHTDGKKSTLELSVVGTELVGTEKGYWVEMGHGGEDSGDVRYGKALVTPEDFTFHKVVMIMPGSTQPMEMDMDAAGKSGRDAMKKNLEKWHTVGNETISVPAGSFACEHWVKDQGKGDVWVSTKIGPLGIVKSVDESETMVLTKMVTNATTHITGTPVKFDPQMMRQRRQP
jgi:hypothetical protein